MMNLSRIEKAAIGTAALLALALSSYQMLARYLAPAYTVDWAGEVVIYLTMWSIWLAGGQLVLEQGHVRADVFIRLLPYKWRYFADTLNTLLGLIFSILMMYCGWKIIELSILLDERGDSSAQLPLWVYYLSLPVGGLALAGRYCQQLLTARPTEEQH